FVLGAVARGVGAEGRDQRAADLGALAGAHAMRAAYDRLFEPPTIAGRPNPRHLERGAYLAIGRTAAARGARANGARAGETAFPGRALLRAGAGGGDGARPGGRRGPRPTPDAGAACPR